MVIPVDQNPLVDSGNQVFVDPHFSVFDQPVNGNVPAAKVSHGTVVASISARTAPAAQIIFIDIGLGGSIPELVADALDFVSTHAQSLNIVAVNMSFGQVLLDLWPPRRRPQLTRHTNQDYRLFGAKGS